MISNTILTMMMMMMITSMVHTQTKSLLLMTRLTIRRDANFEREIQLSAFVGKEPDVAEPDLNLLVMILTPVLGHY